MESSSPPPCTHDIITIIMMQLIELSFKLEIVTVIIIIAVIIIAIAVRVALVTEIVT